MAGQRKKSKVRVTLNIEGALLRAVEAQAARERVNRVQWLIAAAADRLRELGRIP